MAETFDLRRKIPQERIADIQKKFGNDDAFSVMVWPTAFERNQGLGFTAKSGLTLEAAMQLFKEKKTLCACVEVQYGARKMPVCSGGTARDVRRCEWVYRDSEQAS